MRRGFLAFAACILTSVTAVMGVERPRLVVNIVVGGLRWEELDKYSANLVSDGFREFQNRGVVFRNGYYEFMQTNSPATLATLSTGSYPSTHGIVGYAWRDFLTGNRVELISDGSTHAFNSDPDTYRVSNLNLLVPTLGDRLVESLDTEGRCVTVAQEATSAIILGGRRCADVYWMDSARAKWTTTDRYQEALPRWIAEFNDSEAERPYLGLVWRPYYSTQGFYLSRETARIIDTDRPFIRIRIPQRISYRDYDKFYLSPFCDNLLLDFVRHVISSQSLGKDDNVDLLNICLDIPRIVSQLYGPESMETEDMIYRTDALLSELMAFVRTQVPGDRTLFVLTSDHGMSPSYDYGVLQPRDRFNVEQFKVLLNAFLAARYPADENWVSDCIDRNIYLNRQQAYSMGLDLDEIRTQASSFALQFRGVSHVYHAGQMMSASGSDQTRLVGNGYSQKRSGDLVLDLLPEWIEEGERRADSGSLYEYDRHVPLMMTGCMLPAATVYDRVDMAQLAVTLSALMGIPRPAASDADPIEFIESLLRQR